MRTPTAANQTPIAIVGVSALFPGSSDASGFWRDILAGRDLIGDVPPSHWLVDDYYDEDPTAPDKTYARRGGFLDPVGFDALGFGVPPSTLPATDTAQLLALIVAQSVLQDAAREQFDSLDRSRISVILGVTSAQELLFSMVSRLQKPVWVKALRESGLPEDEVQAACARIAAHYVPWQESSFPGLLGNVVAGRIANRLNLGGTNCVTDAACASALSALSMAIQELQLGNSDLVISGGVDTLNDIFMYMCFSKTPALSPSGDCRPFSDQADGTMLGEGLGMVALKRLADAERDGDRIYAVIKGLGSSSDGRSKSVYAPVSAGQAQALRRAYALAGYSPDTVELVEAHGTGTKAGDVAEFEGLRQVFAPANSERTQWCALGSVKSQIGHTKAAAGAAGLFKAVMALHHKVLPPSIKIAAPNPRLAIDTSPFYLNTRARPWIRDSRHPRRASVSAFGFGGSNFHVTLEEYQGASPAERLPAHAHELIVLAAADAATLAANARAMAARTDALGTLARQSRRDFDSTAHARLAVVASDRGQLVARLLAAAQRIEQAPDQAFTLPDGSSAGFGAASGKLAMLFPGQGSQFPGMGADLAMHCPPARAVWDRAADLPFEPGISLHERVFPRPGFDADAASQDAARLTATQWAQPAIGATSLSMLAVLRELGVNADLLGGHSFGEVLALHAAGVLSETDTLKVARRRGELMAQAAATPGAMTALSLPLDQVRGWIERCGSKVVVANHNAPQQVVVSGTLAAIDDFEAQLARHAVAFRRLPVASGFHSQVVAGSCAPFAEFLAGLGFASPRLPVFANASAEVHAADVGVIRATLAAQIAQPVRFVEMIEAMYAAGARTFLEVGPGSVLTGLVAAILGERAHQAIALDRKHKDGIESLLLALARLAANGVAMNLARLFADVRDATAAPNHGRPLTPISGSNVGKPYPPEGGQAALPKPNPPRAIATAPAPTLPSAAPMLGTADAPPSLQTSPETPMNDAHLAWLTAFQASQQQLTEAHASFQRAMFDSHAAFLQLSESALTGLASLAGGQSPMMPVPRAAMAATVVAPAPAPMPVAAAMPAPMPATPMPSSPVASTVVSAPAVVLAAPAIAPALAPAQPGVDLTALMLQIVAEKTGYPVEMLNLGMDLEGDLGIDSIKRVEILAAVDERAPGLAKLDRSRMSALHTVGEIVAYLQGNDLQGQTAPVVAVAPQLAPAVAVNASASTSSVAVDLTALMLQVVAEKTGYPVEMLNLGMDLEGDLGIDSIKRVEILAAVDERAPGLAKLDRSRMSALHTVGEIVAYLQGSDLQGNDLQEKKKTRGLTRAEPPSTPSPDTAAAALGRYRLERIAAAATGLALPGLIGAGEVCILGDLRIGQSSVAAALADALKARGANAVCVATLPDDARACIYLGGLRDIDDAAAAIAVNREAFAIARQFAQQGEQRSGLFVTVQDTGGSFGLQPLADDRRAWLSGLPALVKTAALEWPRAALKAIDLERGDDDAERLAQRLADELFEGGGEIEVGLPAVGGRYTLRSVATPVVAGAAVIDADDVVLVAGGARGVTAGCVIEWARRCRAKFVLLGRTPLREEPSVCHGIDDDGELKRVLLEQARAAGQTLTPPQLLARVRDVQGGRDIRATLAAITAAGGQARYVAVDVADRAALQTVLADVCAQWGPVRGVVHAAGVLADKRIAEKTDAMFDAVFDTKVAGLQALLAATREQPLKLLAVFSSVSARCGNTGQADYAMANEVLAKVLCSEAHRRPDLLAKSFGWGPWAGGMVTPHLRDRFAALGVPMIGMAEGARMFADELTRGQPTQVELVLGGEPRPEALLFDGANARVQTLEVAVARSSHAYLEGHAIHGQPVLPLVLAAEWLSRAARGFRPGLPRVALHDIKVLKGIRLGGFEQDGDRFVIEATPLPSAQGAQMQMRILDAQGHANYSARVELLVESPAGAEKISGQTLLPDSMEPWSGAPLYQDLLFHRGEFELIERLDGISDQGVVATLRGVSHAGWRGESWQLDVAALDAGLQLAVVFGQRLLGGPNLPTGIDQIRAYGLPAEGLIHATAYRRKLGPSAITTDIVFTDAHGLRLAELLGVHNHALA